MESSLAQVEHQIWLLRNVFWWYLLPLALSMLAFFGQVAWQDAVGRLVDGSRRIAEWSPWSCIVFAGVYWLNQNAVRSELEPRRQELEALLTSLKDETPAVRA